MSRTAKTAAKTAAATQGAWAARPPLVIDLALQGGGAHGAFTWGVLDRVLEEDWLTISAISAPQRVR